MMDDLVPELRQAVANAAEGMAETARRRRAVYFARDALATTIADIDRWVLQEITTGYAEQAAVIARREVLRCVLLTLRETRPTAAA